VFSDQPADVGAQEASEAPWAALEDLYVSEAATLRALAERLLPDTTTAQDVVQEAFVRAAMAKRRPETMHDLHRYVARIVVNETRGHWRREQLRRRLYGRLTNSTMAHRVDDPADLSARSSANARMLDALDALPQRQREVILLRFWLDYDVAETAQALRISSGSVKKHTARALAALRESSPNLQPL